MVEMWIPEEWCAAMKCACQSVRDSLALGMTLGELATWFYDEALFPDTKDWDECVLRARWDTYTWRGVFQAWNECGRPWFDPCDWGWDEWDPELRRAAQGNGRLAAVGEMVYDCYPEALEWAARALGWTVIDGSFFPDGRFPEGTVALDPEGVGAAAGRWYVTVLIPPATVSAA